VHGFLASGLQVIEEYFPGIIAEACSHGAALDDAGHRLLVISGSKLHRTELGVMGLVCGRPLLEALIRQRVLALPKVNLRAQCQAHGLALEEGKVGGVHLEQRDAVDGDATITADLVLDATGRGSRSPSWLEELGYAAPRVDRVEVGLTYTSALYRRKPGDFPGSPAVLVDTVPPNRRSAAAGAIHPDHWIVTLIGYLGERATPTHQGFLDFSSGMPSPEIHTFLRGSEPVSEFTSMGFRQSQWRRFDELERHPEGFIVTGDALCCFNPRFGQGVAVAALEAKALGECLQAGGQANLRQRYYRRIQPLLDAAWSSSVGNDLRFAEVEGQRTWVGNILNRYIDRVCAAAARDAEVSRRFLRVVHMLEKPESLFSPRVLTSVVRRLQR
jgi:2-polyprenyl-6-methoxyphenol hydroxylase-like FAD-dependent oxidoreductase